MKVNCIKFNVLYFLTSLYSYIVNIQTAEDAALAWSSDAFFRTLFFTPFLFACSIVITLASLVVQFKQNFHSYMFSF